MCAAGKLAKSGPRSFFLVLDVSLTKTDDATRVSKNDQCILVTGQLLFLGQMCVAPVSHFIPLLHNKTVASPSHAMLLDKTDC